MSEKIIIEGRLPSLNTLIAGMNKNRYIGNKIKQDNTKICETAFRTQCKNKYEKVSINFLWVEKDKRRDKDNVASAKKFILDGMQKAGIIKNDNWNGVEGFRDDFAIDKDNPRIEITLIPVN